uniref:DDE Tnp4 domain-containing protein n=1 Tax=Sinocyclocheilus rhinocerous TaxID=307959 RepID=A0A673ME73_9TELE
MDVTLTELIVIFALLAYTFINQQCFFCELLLSLLGQRRRLQAALQHPVWHHHITLMPFPPPITRHLWMKIQSQDWWERVVLKEFSHSEWKQNFRMTQQHMSSRGVHSACTHSLNNACCRCLHGEKVKGWPSYVLQAVVDDQGCESNFLYVHFIHVHTHLVYYPCGGCPWVYLRLMVVGDPAYPLLDWLIKGYTGFSQSYTRAGIIQCLPQFTQGRCRDGVRQAEVKVASALKRSDFHFSFAPTMIATCCALHNFCEKRNDGVNLNWLNDICETDQLYPQPTQPVTYTENRHFQKEDITTYSLFFRAPERGAVKIY